MMNSTRVTFPSHQASSSSTTMLPPRNTHSNKPTFKANKISLNTKSSSGSANNLGARWGHSSCLVEDRRLFIIGGIGNNLVHDTCLFDFGSLAWIEAHTAGKSPGSRYGHTTVLLSAPSVLEKTCILLFGDTSSLTWTCFSSDKSFPDPRAGHTAVLMRHPSLAFPRLVVFGGNYHNKYLNTVYIMDIISSDNFQWYKPNVKGTPPCPRSGHTCTHIPGTTKMIVFGGFDGKKCFNDIYIFCTATFTWTPVTPYGVPPRPRSGHTAALVGGRFWVIFGGCSDAVFLNDFHILDLMGGGAGGEQVLQWLPQPTLPITISARFHHSCDPIDRSIIIFGGCAAGTLFNDMTSLDVSALWELPDPYQLPPQSSPRITPTTTTTNTTPSPTLTTPTPATPTPTLTATPPSTPPATPAVPTATITTPTSTTITATPGPPSLEVIATPISPPLPLEVPSTPETDNSSTSTISTTPTPSHASTEHSSTPQFSHPFPPASTSSPAPLTVLHSTTTYITPDIVNLKRKVNPKFTSIYPGDTQQQATAQHTTPQQPQQSQQSQQSQHLEICLAAALTSLKSEQQKLNDLELNLSKERAAHAALRADFVSEQIKVKELEGRLVKTEKKLRKSQKWTTEGKMHSQAELQKAHTQITSLRTDLAKMTEKCESDRRPHQHTTHNSHHPAQSPHQTQQPQPQSPPPQKSLLQEYTSVLELCTSANLELLDLDTLTNMHIANMKASELIVNAKNKKIEQLVASMEAMRLDLESKALQQQEKEEELQQMASKVAQLEEEHAVEKENLKHLTGEGLENMDTEALEKLEEIHHTGLRNVGVAKTQALFQQVARLQREKAELAERVVCVVCVDAQINTILSPCGHRCLCKGCANLLSSCPLCRTPIVDKLQYFQ